MKNYWILKLSRVAILFFLCCSLTAFAQFSEPELSIPDDEDYLYPVHPGIPGSGSLAGNMGELRGTHFHSGLDVRTNNEVGHPVKASKSGYISRVAMSPSGYGNVIYISHPDGNTTLYAHLLNFTEPLASYVRQQQYKQKSFNIDLVLGETDFVVKRGDIIAISGNSGSSGGPHLHFDIRDKNNLALNPLKFGFKEIVDKTPPTVQKIALITLDENSRINNEFGRFEFYVSKAGDNYVVNTPITVSGTIGIEIQARDKFLPGGEFYGGVNYINMQVNNELVFDQSIDKIDLEGTRGIYTLIDYKTFRTKGSKFYKLYIDDGNDLPFYDSSPGSGKIRTTGEAKIDIHLSDPFGNKTVTSLKLKPSPVVKKVYSLPAARSQPTMEIFENTLMVTQQPCPASEEHFATLYNQGETQLIEASYFNNKSAVYLIDLRKYLPDSIVSCNQTIKTNFLTRIPSGTDYKYYSDWLDIEFPATALYDTLYLTAQLDSSSYDIFSLGDRTFPLNKNITIALKPWKEFTKDKTLAVYRISGRSRIYYGGEWKNGRIEFSTRDLGSYTLLYDTQPPTIKASSLSSNGVRLKIDDDLSGIDHYEAKINGNWLLMHYDQKTRTIWSEQYDKTSSLKGRFELTVTDRAGNKEFFIYDIP